MLQSIRDKAQNWIFLIIIFLLVIAFAFFGIERFFDGSTSNKVVAKVDGHKISANELQTTYERMKRQLQIQFGNEITANPKVEANLKKQALQQIIHTYVLTQAAEKQGYLITQDQLDAVVTSLPLFQVNGKFSPERFQIVLNNLFYSESSFLDQLRSSMLIDQLQSGLIDSTFVLPSEVSTAYELINQKRDFIYFIIPANRFKDQVKITEQEKKNYYKANQKEFANPERVSISYLELSLDDLIHQQKFTEEKLHNYYQNNLASFTTPARYHIAQILVRLQPNATKEQEEAAKKKILKIENLLKEKQNFSQVAKKYSEDIFTAKKGGVLPWFSNTSVDPQIFNAVKDLKVNQISNPVRTKYGISVFKLLGHQPEKTKSFSEVKGSIENIMARQRAEQLFASQTDELSNITFSDSGSLKSAAKALNLPIQTTPEFTRKGLKAGIASNPKIINAAFSNTVLQQNYNSDPIQLSNNNVVVLRVKSHTPASIKPYKEVETQIQTMLEQKAEAQKAFKLGQSIINAAKTEEQLKELAQKNQLKLITEINVGRHSSLVPGNILDNVFKQDNPQANQINTDGLQLANGDYAVIAVTKVLLGDVKELSSSQAKIYREQLSKQQGELEYGLYAEQQLQSSDIKIE